MKDHEMISRKFRLAESEYIARNLEIMNVLVFPVRLGKTHLSVLEFFIRCGGDINTETRAKAREHFNYTTANLGNYISEFRRVKCLTSVGPNWERVVPGVMLAASPGLAFSVTVDVADGSQSN